MEQIQVCPKCGTKLLDGAKFCIKCGMQVEIGTEPHAKQGTEREGNTVDAMVTERNKRNGAGYERVKNITRLLGMLFCLFIIVTFYQDYQDNKYIKVLQRQNYGDICYEKLFENYSEEVSWKCLERKRFTVVDPNHLAGYSEVNRGGGFEAVVAVSGDCYVYDEKVIYTLEFNVSKENDRVVPEVLRYGDVIETSDEEITQFLNSVYRTYSGHELTGNEEISSETSSVTVLNCYLTEELYQGMCVNVTYQFINTSANPNSFLYLYDDYVFQNGVGCENTYAYSEDYMRNVASGAQYSLTKQYALENNYDDIEISVSASWINAEDTSDIVITVPMEKLKNSDMVVFEENE